MMPMSLPVPATPPFPVHPSASTSSSTVSRRPLSPSSLRDVDPPSPSRAALPTPRGYPAPPTGHELMALFPAPPPAGAPELRAGPTSGYFARQERAFFAQAGVGRELVRVRLDIDMPHHKSRRPSTGVPSLPTPKPWMANGGQPTPVPAPLYIPSKAPPTPPTQQRARSASSATTTPPTPTDEPDHENKDDDDRDDAWRRPMPYNERRRAGKHTRRVVVR
ncbi:hypothetical protein MIND_00394700 [Mycena indigotica]|uniref:Uncharacterized protein n=1 Tax=Mycena indigotica TaxID=2126181 RepID=A0A8H6T6A3_9AGAR|nr:uncharacterized protein MIND_00394700 [Mycena indigotica]KAF7310210.1 hypothetical protein MIND_00394700 [Mycena indigotica]